jgi:hypothetical protein
MAEVSLSVSIFEEIAARGAITAQDVLDLRQGVFKDGIVDREEAEAVFRLDQACKTKDPSWTQFYVDSLTDYFVWQAKPSGHLGEEQARFLIDNVACDGHIDGASELELLLNVMRWARSCPEELSVFVLEAVRGAVLSPQTAALGRRRVPAVITEADVEIIRALIYAGASGGGFTVTRREAELLFELNDASRPAENAPGWQGLFVKAIASHLMFPRGAPKVADAEEVLRRESWLKERGTVGGLFKRIAKSIAGGDIPLSESWREADIFGGGAASAEREREEARLREALNRESIDEAEATWLIGRVRLDGVLQPNERALLVFLKDNAPNIHPSLNDLLAEAGV